MLGRSPTLLWSVGAEERVEAASELWSSTVVTVVVELKMIAKQIRPIFSREPSSIIACSGDALLLLSYAENRYILITLVSF